MAASKSALFLLAFVALAIVCATPGAVAYAASTSGASSSGAGASRALSVSTVENPATLRPGHTYTVAIRVINSGSRALTVKVRGEGIDLGDNGKVSFTGQPDKFWAEYVTFPSGNITVPAQSFATVPITVRMPASIKPDFYYIGFLVTPVVTASTGITIVNQIGGFQIVDVPGPRAKKISAYLSAPVTKLHFGGVVIGSNAIGDLVVRNTGKTAVTFWGENDISMKLGAMPPQQRFDSELLPVGRIKQFTLKVPAVWPINVVTMRVTVFYHGRTDATSKQIVLTRRMLVISPWAIVLAFVFVACAAWGLLYARHLHRSGPGSTASTA